MRRFTLILALFTLTACRDQLTDPTTLAVPDADGAAERAISIDFIGDPPPPPVDTGVVALSDAGASFLGVTYFLNRPQTHGWLTFTGSQSEGTSVTGGARVTYQRGVYSGKGTLSYAAGAGMVTVDLSSVGAGTSFTSCAKGCFSLRFTRASYSSGGVTRPLASGVIIGPERGRVIDEVIGKAP